MEFEKYLIRSAVAALVGIVCMTASCAEFVGELYQAEWYSKTDCGFWLPNKEEWDAGDQRFDEYMEVDGVKYPERSYYGMWKNFLLIPVILDKPGEKFTPVVVNGTTSGEVGISVMTDEQVYSQFRNSQTSWMGYWLNEVFPNGKTSSCRAWIKVMPGQSKTKLRANVDLSERPAAGIYSNYTMTELAMKYGVDYFKGVYAVAPSTWYAIGIKETGQIFVPTESGLDSPRLYVSQLESCKAFFKAFPIDDMEEMMREDRCEAIVCPAAWYVSAKDAGGAELVVWSDNIRGGTVLGNGIYKPGTKVSLRATANKDYVFAGWYDADGNPLTGGSADYRTATYAYVTTDKDVTLTAKFATKLEDASSLKLVNITNCTVEAGCAFTKDMSPHVESHSTPKLAVSGLPAGLKYDAKTMTISGKATKPGVYTVKVAATNASVKKATDGTTRTFKITVPNFETFALPRLDPAPDAYALTVGVVNEASVLDLTVADGYLVSSVSGLPAGLKYDKKANTVTGKPAKAGTYTVTVTAAKGKEKQVATVTLTVDPLPDWVVGTFNGDGYYKTADSWHGYEAYDFIFNLTVANNGKLTGSITVDVTEGKQEKAAFSAASAVGYEENAHVVLWWDWDEAVSWYETMAFDGPAYYYDVDIKLDGKTKRRRLYICDMKNGALYDGEERVYGVAVAGFGEFEAVPWQDVVFCGEALRNLWADKSYDGPIPKFATSAVTKQKTTEDGDVCTFSFKKNGSVAVTVVRADGQRDSASFTLNLMPQEDGTWFRAYGTWIFSKGWISSVDLTIKPNGDGLVGPDEISIDDIDLGP